MSVKVVIADYGAGNLRSVTSALVRAGCDPVVSVDPAAVIEAPLAVIAGVGHVESAARGLARHGLDDAIAERAAAGRPVLGICVGMQLLCGESEEGGRGLGLLAAPVRRLRSAHVPHMGWNALAVDAAVRAARRPRRRGRLLRPQLRRRAGGVRRHGRRGRPRRRRSSRRSSRERSPECSFIPERSGAGRRSPARERGAMVKKRVIPCLDVAGGRVVKGVSFENLRDVGDPIELATRYSELAADELVFLDITATLEDRGPMLGLVERAAEELSIPFTVGGGVTGLGDARALLRAGADKVAVNRAAFDDPSMLTALADEFGSQAVVCAVDARAGEVVTHGGRNPRGRGAVEWAQEAVARGAGEILLTSIDADGTRAGIRPRADARGRRRRWRPR